MQLVGLLLGDSERPFFEPRGCYRGNRAAFLAPASRPTMGEVSTLLIYEARPFESQVPQMPPKKRNHPWQSRHNPHAVDWERSGSAHGSKAGTMACELPQSGEPGEETAFLTEVRTPDKKQSVLSVSKTSFGVASNASIARRMERRFSLPCKREVIEM